MRQVVVSVVLLVPFLLFASDEDVRVAKWKDDKKAAFGLMFDDSMSTHIKNVLPELKKRNLIGTYYVNPGSAQFKQYKGAWEVDIPASGGVLANHTFTHKGAKDTAALDTEITKADEVIRAIDKNATLISFGRPGVKQGEWLITKEQLAEAMTRHKMLLRPDVLFAGIHLKTSAEMIARLDKTLESGGMGFVAFHGVGGEWLSIDMPAFIALLDALAARREQLWIADTISMQKYEAERATAKAVVEKQGAELRVKLTSGTDPALYNQPLTLIAKVPPDWTKCTVTQGSRSSEASVNKGSVMFDVRPNAEVVVLKP